MGEIIAGPRFYHGSIVSVNSSRLVSAFLGSGLTLKGMVSLGLPPRPNPTSILPLVRWSNSAMSSASRIGCHMVVVKQANPILIRLVRHARSPANRIGFGELPKPSVLRQPYGVKPQLFTKLDLLTNIIQYLSVGCLMLPIIYLGVEPKFHDPLLPR